LKWQQPREDMLHANSMRGFSLSRERESERVLGHLKDDHRCACGSGSATLSGAPEDGDGAKARCTILA
jgi:hypothetical protein